MTVLSACINVRRHDVCNMYDVYCIAHMTRLHYSAYTTLCATVVAVIMLGMVVYQQVCLLHKVIMCCTITTHTSFIDQGTLPMSILVVYQMLCINSTLAQYLKGAVISRYIRSLILLCLLMWLPTFTACY
jgi:hypothetical protein